MRRIATIAIALGSVVGVPWSIARAPAAEGAVLRADADGGPPTEMMRRYLTARSAVEFAARRERFEQIRSPADVLAWQTRLRRELRERLGDLPARTSLQPRTTGRILRPGYRIEKVLFASRPSHHVTASLFLPDPPRGGGPGPGVVIPCGHSADGKAAVPYQTAAALLALHGIVALVFDPIDQGERHQYLSEDGKTETWGTRSHMITGVRFLLLGGNTATFEIWDGMRAIDYLQSRPEVDPDRIGCMGNSGGGTQTAQLMALDDRVAVASPSCYITSLERLLATIGAQDAEQNISGQIGFGLEHADYILLRAPRPTLICANTRDFFDIEGTWDSFRQAKRVYTRLGWPERVDLIENDDRHGYHRPNRQAAVRWMLRWLDGRDVAVEEPDIEPISAEELQVTPDGEVLLLPGERSTHDILSDAAATAAAARTSWWGSATDGDRRAAVRRVTGIRTAGELPRPTVERRGRLRVGGTEVEGLVVRPEPGILLPALLLRPAGDATRITVCLDGRGKERVLAPDGPARELVRSGSAVLAVDLRGLGETRQPKAVLYSDLFGTYGKELLHAYLLGTSYVAMRAEDVIACARAAAEVAELPPGGRVDLLATDEAAVPALHAAALEPELFGEVTLARALDSWTDVVLTRIPRNPLVDAVHGVLRVYDLPDLRALVGDRLRGS